VLPRSLELELLERRLRSTARQNVFIGLMSLLAVASIGHAIATEPKRIFRGEDGWMTLALIPACLALAAVMLKRAREMSPPHESVVYRALHDDPRDLVWVHLTTGLFSAVTLNFRNGRFFRVYANDRDKQVLLAFVMRRAPHALTGYGDAERKAYRAIVRAATPPPRT
jgi:hypothetical protein